MVRGLRVVRYIVVSIALIALVYKFSVKNVNYSSLVGQSMSSVTKPAGAAAGEAAEAVKDQTHAQTPALDEKTSAAAAAVAKAADIQLENATFVSLVRNDDMMAMVASIRQVEDRFNHRFHYPWTFINDKPFSDEFVQMTSAFTSGKTHYIQIPDGMWSYPEFIDQSKAADTREKMSNIIYGWSESYRHMCRFESHFAEVGGALDKYKYYWRVEPHIKLTCDIVDDPFRVMREGGHRYGFTISLYEYEATIETLWSTVKDWMKAFPQYIHPNNAMDFISDDGGEKYNLCHFWSNFEIGDLDFWRSPAYKSFFNHLDQAGGFYYERWGDAPVHSIAAALMMDKKEIHFFEDIGYWHVPFQSCPVDERKRLELRCTCPSDESLEEGQRNIFTFAGYSCTPRWYKMLNKEKPLGWQKYQN